MKLFLPEGLMSRSALQTLVLSGILVLTSGTALAQRPRIKIDDARIGLPPGSIITDRDTGGRASHILKRNVWGPVYVDLEMLTEYEGAVNLRVESTDADELKTTLVVPLARTLADRRPGEKIQSIEFGYLPYVRVGDRLGDVTLTVVSDGSDGRVRELSEPYRFGSNRALQLKETSTYIVLSLGSKLPGFDLPADTARAVNQVGRTTLRNGKVQTAAITNVRELPDQWFGYNAADLVVLTTGSATNDFLDELFDAERSRPFKPRRDALFEWVRRGGRLIISVGSNAAKLSQSELFRDLLPATLKPEQPSQAVPQLPLRWRMSDGAILNDTIVARTETFPVARLNSKVDRAARVLIPQADAGGFVDPAQAELPAVVQAPYGLGRITVVAFDLDQSPFTELNRKGEFWDWLLREAGSQRGALASESTNNVVYSSNVFDTGDEIAGSLRSHVDRFEGIPVISFGWVALFIILYTLLIGPIEYLFLKKIVGRLELTWITFPLIVLSVSAAAYFTAYAIKGNDLKLNKIDLLDIDLAGNKVYGRSWFTVFSPRIDSYTIAMEPREGWAVSRPDQPESPALMDWMAGGRSGSGSIVSRGYSYHTELTGQGLAIGQSLDRVPIQVWSTKAFTANWSGSIDPGTPLVQADLYHPPADNKVVTGSFTTNIPIKLLSNPVLFYAGKAYKLPALTPGQKVDIPPIGPNAEGLPVATDWFTSNAGVFNYQNMVRGNQGMNDPGMTPASNLMLWSLLFHEKSLSREIKALQNSSLRELDQSWRITEDNLNEAILVAYVDQPSGPAEEMMTSADGPSPTKLWLRGRPGGSDVREPVPGTLRQETYIRVYIPIRSAAGRK